VPPISPLVGPSRRHRSSGITIELLVSLVATSVLFLTLGSCGVLSPQVPARPSWATGPQDNNQSQRDSPPDPPQLPIDPSEWVFKSHGPE